MNLYHIQSTLHGVDRTTSFLENNFIGIVWPATGDLEQMSSEEWREQLVQRYALNEMELNRTMDTLHTFVNIMQDGDFILIDDDEWVYVGDVGDYFYDDSSGTGEDLICHRRGVTWLGRIPLTAINDKVRALLNDSSIVVKFDHPLSQAQLDPWLSIAPKTEMSVQDTVRVDERIIQQALDVLKEALQSEDADLRIRAATAILQYVKS
ncbi:hypothetical protein [Paenibacillus sp. MABNR03]|uniref:hypothetical protein n=1 Tax=Paenibacillus sp. MABNR03 TaxID=3142626 RepID=UPI003D29EC27